MTSLLAKPCVKCGAVDRYANGACKPCKNVRLEELAKISIFNFCGQNAILKKAQSIQLNICKAWEVCCE
jgi:hypothetical protein